MNVNEKIILKAKILGAIEYATFYKKLSSTLGDKDTWPCTKETAQAEYESYMTMYDILTTLALEMCPSGLDVHQWLSITNEDIKQAKTLAYKHIEWCREEAKA